MSYIFLVLNVLGALLSGITFGYYYPIWRSMRTSASLLLLFLPTATMMMSIYHVVTWYIEFRTLNDPCEIQIIYAWHTIQVAIVLAMCSFQLLLLVWRPSWFRQVRKTDGRG